MRRCARHPHRTKAQEDLRLLAHEHQWPDPPAVSAKKTHLRPPGKTLRLLEGAPGARTPEFNRTLFVSFALADSSRRLQKWDTFAPGPQTVVIVRVGVREAAVDGPHRVADRPGHKDHISIERVRALDFIGGF